MKGAEFRPLLRQPLFQPSGSHPLPCSVVEGGEGEEVRPGESALWVFRKEGRRGGSKDRNSRASRSIASPFAGGLSHTKLYCSCRLPWGKCVLPVSG